MKIIGYCRVSTAGQAESGLSIEAQETKLRAYCELYNHELVLIIHDAGFSAKSLNRPGLSRALSMLASGEAEGLLIAKLDRLTRSVKDLGSLIDNYFSEQAGKGCLLSVQDQVDTSSAGGRLVLNVLMSVAQWEREAISERTSDALQARASRGLVKGGQAPTGKQWHEGALVAHDAEAEAVAIVHELRESGLSLRQIVAELNTLGVPTRQGAKWHLTSVSRVLKRAI